EIADLVLSREVFSRKPKTFNKQYLVRNVKAPIDYQMVAASRDRDGYPKPGDVKVPLGATSVEWKNGGLEFKTAKGLNSEVLALPGFARWYGFADPVRSGDFQEGWYRLKFRAGAF